ncbi:MAG TPA: helix-turn-helix domain-containing protein [Streptosporangiaceae bacterium]|nr:helix-turn-helix domain-containing protein [Streptosporangiaceae bacterium]
MTTYSAVVTTGIYCRPGCGARPLARNVRTFDLAAAAEAAGFRACQRCRPYRVAGPVGSSAPEIVCEAVQLIIGGALDDGGTEAALASQIGMSQRHLRRLFLKHLGASPDQLARSRRAHFARRLLDDTDLAIGEIAFASGFGSLRQFNRAMREVFRSSPSDLRDRRRRSDRLAADGGLALRLPVEPGYDWAAARSALAASAIPGVATAGEQDYRRVITMAGEPGLIEVSPGGRDGGQDCLLLRVHLPYWEGLIHVVDRIGRLLGIDADHAVAPGWTSFEAGVCDILAGSERSEPGLLAAFVDRLGTAVPGLPAGLTHAFPDPSAVTEQSLKATGLPETEAAAIAVLAQTCNAGEIPDPPSGQWRPWLALARTDLMGAALR